MNIEIKRLSSTAPFPKQATDGSAGFDLTNQGVSIKDGWHMMRTGIAIHIKDPNIVGLVFNRSSIPVRLANAVGVIDSDYQGEIILRTNSAGFCEIGDKIAQLVFVPIIRPTFTQVEEFSEVTKRGNNGFGSTGV